MTERDDVPPVVDDLPPVEQQEAPEPAMGTGSDAGTPGENLDDRPLTAEELALLGNLSQDAPEVVDDVVEESPGVAAAVDDDSPLPPLPPERLDPDADDADTPRFREP